MQDDFLKTDRQWKEEALAAKRAKRRKIGFNIVKAIIAIATGLILIFAFLPLAHYRSWHPTNTPMNIPEPTIPPSHGKKAPHRPAQPRQDPIAHHDL